MSSGVNIRHQVTQHVMDWGHKGGSIGRLDKAAEGHLGLFVHLFGLFKTQVFTSVKWGCDLIIIDNRSLKS